MVGIVGFDFRILHQFIPFFFYTNWSNWLARIRSRFLSENFLAVPQTGMSRRKVERRIFCCR